MATRLVETRESEKEGLEALMGEKVTLFCCNYIYTGKLVVVNDKYVTLKDPSIVYETGAFTTSEWKDAQRLPKEEWSVMLHAIESFGIMK